MIHIDTGHNFKETLDFRDNLVKKLGVKLIIGSVQESIDKKIVKEETGPDASRNSLQIITLLDTLEKNKIDSAMEVRGEMRKRQEQKNAFSLTGMNLVNGTQKINVLNFGICSMAEKIMVNTLEFFLSLIGLKWMCGNIFEWKRSPSKSLFFSQKKMRG